MSAFDLGVEARRQEDQPEKEDHGRAADFDGGVMKAPARLLPPAIATAQFLASTAIVASAETVMAVPSAMASTERMPPTQSPFRNAKAQDDQRARAGAQSDGDDGRPGGASS